MKTLDEIDESTLEEFIEEHSWGSYRSRAVTDIEQTANRFGMTRYQMAVIIFAAIDDWGLSRIYYGGRIETKPIRESAGIFDIYFEHTPVSVEGYEEGTFQLITLRGGILNILNLEVIRMV